jgi:uncharacterized repeat protein (TIGR04076 family)
MVPHGRCSSAGAEVRQDILAVAMGADLLGIRQPDTIVTGCRDWFRPATFRIETMNSV